MAAARARTAREATALTARRPLRVAPTAVMTGAAALLSAAMLRCPLTPLAISVVRFPVRLPAAPRLSRALAAALPVPRPIGVRTLRTIVW